MLFRALPDVTTRVPVSLLLIVALLLSAAAPFAVIRYRIAKSRAFCDAVAALPRGQLDEFSSRCERLMRDHGGSEAGLEIIKDSSTLAEFALAGKTPYEIVLQEGTVGIKYIGGNWRYSTIAIWEEDSAPNGGRVKVLKITYGTYGWRILSQREVQNDDDPLPTSN